MLNDLPDTLPLLFLNDGVLLPGASMRFKITSQRNLNMVNSRLLSQNNPSSIIIGIIPLEPGTDEVDPVVEQGQIGTAAVVVQVTGTRNGYTVLVTGLCRFQIIKYNQEFPYPVAYVHQCINDHEIIKQDDRKDEKPSELDAIIKDFRVQALDLLDLLDVSEPIIANLKKMLNRVPSNHLADIISSIVKASFAERKDILDAVSVEERFKKALPLLERQIKGIKMMKRAHNDIVVKNNPRRIIFKDDDVDNSDIHEIENKLENNLPTKAYKIAHKELNRLKKMNPQMPEYLMLRSYLELLGDLPWNKSSDETLDISKARIDLDSDHHAMNKVKERILEYLAVRKLGNSLTSPILCFVGPPGVGKTSIGKSIAKTTGREFLRISVGGISDQSEIRGHRRTYIGSMPGRIIQGLKTAGVNNPVFLLDEIDKMTKGIHGDPAAALLEVLDPEQNFSFFDHYLNLPFDLSQVMFIATANDLRDIPRPLKDRMEIIYLSGYTQEEKIPIVLKHLLPKQLKQHGIESHQIKISPDIINYLVSRYTREAGVRSLERQIAKLLRFAAVKISEENVTCIHFDKKLIENILGITIYDNDDLADYRTVGVCQGLAWTPTGGQVLIVEASKMTGNGKIILTGQLGDVMKESATVAQNWIRSNLRIDIDKLDIHIHFPAGSVGKDGPSAGITICTALVSLFKNRLVRPNLAMTGELTLRGAVLPVGGIKEKILAAHRLDIRDIILPKRNEKDMIDVPCDVKNRMNFYFVEHVEECLEIAFNYNNNYISSNNSNNNNNSSKL